MFLALGTASSILGASFWAHRVHTFFFLFVHIHLIMSSPNFTAADFTKWNQTSSCFRIPKQLIAKESISQVRVSLIPAIGSAKVYAIQALPENKYRLEFTSQQHKNFFDTHGLDFRGVNITPTLAYEQFIRVIIDRAPIDMPDEYLTSSLVPFGRVVSVQHPTVCGFPNIRTGTRMVSMSILKPIPPELTIANFKCSIKYHSQPKFCFGCRSFGHFARLCPRSKVGAKARRTMADVVSTQRLSVPSQEPVQPSSVLAVGSAGSPVNVGESTLRDYVSPSSALSCPAVAMDISFHCVCSCSCYALCFCLAGHTCLPCWIVHPSA